MEQSELMAELSPGVPLTAQQEHQQGERLGARPRPKTTAYTGWTAAWVPEAQSTLNTEDREGSYLARQAMPQPLGQSVHELHTA